jgi:hypothetical protein
MTAQTETTKDERTDQPPRVRFAWHRIAAIVAWLGGAFTTWLLLDRATPGLPWLVGALIAGLVQWTLTIAERPVWRWALRRRGGRLALLGLVVTIVDGVINAGGLYPHVGRLARTDVGAMVTEVLSVQQVMTPRASALLAFALGLVIAGLPEYLWEAGEGK